jgi:carbamoyltransferase
MNILGVNSGRAAPARYDPGRLRGLADGSAALLADGRVACAVLEERHSRVKYAGGFARAAPAVLAQSDCTPESVDAIGLSTCCDSPWTHAKDRLELMVEELAYVYTAARIRSAWAGRVHCVNHHDSHAALAFVGSGWDRALVGVLDGFGNRLDDTARFHTDHDWWCGSFERQTFYLAEWIDGRMRLERVSETAAGPDEIGFAELYRSVTHFCGWPSYQYAGKTMALSAFGDWRRLQRLILAEVDELGVAKVRLASRHDDPMQQISEAVAAAGYDVPKGLAHPATPATGFLADLAALLQHQVEASLIAEVSRLADWHGVGRVALAGGLALNCVGLGKLAVERPDLDLYVPPAPGDTGQGLGNALWLAYGEASPVTEANAPGAITTAALGPVYSPRHVSRAARKFVSQRRGVNITSGLSSSALASATAEYLLAGRIVGVRTGRSEYGPRALGQCSILADASFEDAHRRVNRTKNREVFRPFGASVLRESVQSCFERAVASPFMSFASSVTSDLRAVAPAIVHVDGTTRYQTVDSRPCFLRKLIEAVHGRGGPPLVLNTSFNLAGQPIVETPEDALDVFDRSSLDGLVLGSHWITKC